MAEFQEVMKQYNRMFEAHRKGVTIPIEASYETAVKQPDFFEKCVMEWAAEHPVVYPTWVEWLQSLGVIPYLSGYVANRDDDGNYLNGHVNVNEVAHKPIPVDIAQKLGIKPKKV